LFLEDELAGLPFVGRKNPLRENPEQRVEFNTIATAGPLGSILKTRPALHAICRFTD
jgi:hypothetical protein